MARGRAHPDETDDICKFDEMNTIKPLVMETFGNIQVNIVNRLDKICSFFPEVAKEVFGMT